ncbi:alpha-mannosidase [Mucilaginibacter sp. PPCGB 2223]|uniref:GH92 family glycosyl hydrolase n=1 Tax=Mucilaginibacter sp. PPCGB 2223 TaxID=1886027 RepID=UPI00082597B0|nr:GH92 family glycosyl hydrolase [Mucilaginibacter sp. PPCGB 2223]OCX52725.1 alpha-mannosidase [Mucilaginibacter sp. PPCGB 2223]
MQSKINKVRLRLILTLCCLALMLGGNLYGQDLIPYVQPLSGTAGATTAAATRHGSGTELNANTIPAVTLPFAMTQWTAETRRAETKCQPPYAYADAQITGFRATHWLSGSCTQDYGSLTIMPVGGHLKTSPADYRTAFSHRDEVTAPNYYSVKLPAYHLRTEITATRRCGMLQFTAEKTDSLYLLITPNSDRGEGFIKVDAKRGLVWGYNPAHRIYQGWGKPAGFSGYFVIQFERPVGTSGVYSGARLIKADSLQNSKDIGAYVGFKMQQGEKLCIRVGSSFTSLNAAFDNLRAEITDWDFGRLVAKNKQVWQRALGKIKVQTADLQNKRIFYTAMYHAMQMPRLFNDVTGAYPQFAGNYQINKTAKGEYFDDFSMWDIYRAQLPLFGVLNPELINNCARSMILKGQQGGWLPIFPCWNSYTGEMIGDHVTAFIASAYLKGIRGYDINEAYRLSRQNAFDTPSETDYQDGKGRRALTSYLKYGYIPVEDSVQEAFHKKEQVSRTMEYAYDDYALSRIAKALHKTADAALLTARSFNYRNVFDPSVGMVRARHADQSWYQPFRPSSKEFYITEGTPQQYTFYVPQDVKGLARLMGGAGKLETALDKLFDAGEYWHGNEPGHQIPFMYNYTPSPWKTQLRVKQILEEEYSDGPGGLSGNDDAGQMSAWYVFASLGFYPLDPVSGQYLLTSPLFSQYSIALPNGKHFSVRTHATSAKAAYITAVKFNGKYYSKNYITHNMIMTGGLLEFYLTDRPDKNWAVNPADQPASLTQ